MSNLKHFFHYHKGTPKEKSIKIAASFLMASMLFTWGFSSLWSQAAQEQAAFLTDLLPEPSVVRVGVDAATLSRAINQNFVQLKNFQRLASNLPRAQRKPLAAQLVELLRTHAQAKLCYQSGDFGCAKTALQNLQIGLSAISSGPGPLPAIGPGPLPASGPGPLPASGPGPLPPNVQSSSGPLPATPVQSGPGPLPAEVQSGPGPLPAP